MKIVMWISGILVLMAVFVWQQWPTPSPTITMCDVGQGDALVLMEQYSQIVIDAGPKNGGVISCLGSVMPFWDRYVETVVITHADSDHMGGLDELLNRYAVITVITTEAAYERVKEVVKNRSNIAVSWLNHQWVFGSITGEVMWPPPVPVSTGISVGVGSKNNEDDNRSSLVVRLQWEGESIWLAGDSDEWVEERLLELGLVKPTKTLKVGHHGSKSSTSVPFLTILRPLQAWVSVGKDNRYGHPADETMDRLTLMGISVRRTDMEGMIR